MCPTKKSNTLTSKQRRFVAEYLIDLNATQAAIRAGYSARTAYSIACENLTKPEIAQAVAAGKAAALQKLDVTALQVLQEMARIGLSDVRKLYRPDGSLKPAPEWDDEAAAFVAGVEVVEMAGGMKIDTKEGGAQHVPMYTKKVRLWDKNTALTNLGKHFGLLKDLIEHTGKDGGPIQTLDVSKLSTDTIRRILAETAAV